MSNIVLFFVSFGSIWRQLRNSCRQWRTGGPRSFLSFFFFFVVPSSFCTSFFLLISPPNKPAPPPIFQVRNLRLCVRPSFRPPTMTFPSKGRRDVRFVISCFSFYIFFLSSSLSLSLSLSLSFHPISTPISTLISTSCFIHRSFLKKIDPGPLCWWSRLIVQFKKKIRNNNFKWRCLTGLTEAETVTVGEARAGVVEDACAVHRLEEAFGFLRWDQKNKTK